MLQVKLHFIKNVTHDKIEVAFEWQFRIYIILTL